MARTRETHVDPTRDENKSRRPARGVPPVRYSKEETREQLEFVAALDAKYATQKQIQDLWQQEKGTPLARARVMWLVARVRESWKEEDERARPFWKARQIRALEDDIRAARAKKDYTAVARFQQLLAKIMGTEEPVRVEVDVVVTQAIMQVIGGMTIDQLTEALTEQRALEQDAKRFRAITVQATPTPAE